MSPAHRDVSGALGGSRILAHPEVAAEVAAFHAAIGSGAGRSPRPAEGEPVGLCPRRGRSRDLPSISMEPTLLEIGFDHGRRLSATASANPGWTVIGLEVRKKRVAEMRTWAERESLSNLHAFRLDARAVLANAMPAASVDIIEVLFPTPWPAGKARRRLLVTTPFLEDVARALRPGGLLHVATDVAWYAELIELASEALADGVLTPADPAQALARRPACPQRSRREWVCERDDIPVFRFAWERPTSK